MIEEKLPPLPPVKEILKQKADLLTDEPIIVTIGIEPKNRKEKFMMFFGLKPRKIYYTIKGSTMRTMLKVSKLLLDIDYVEKPDAGAGALPWAYKCVSDNAELLVKILCTAIHNQNSPYDPEMENMILDNCEAKHISHLAFNIVKKLDIWTFTDTITSIRTINILEKVSLQPAEIIAPEKLITGEELAVLSSIFDGAKVK